MPPPDQSQGDEPIQMADIEQDAVLDSSDLHYGLPPTYDVQSALSSNDGRDPDGSDDGTGNPSANNRLEVFRYLARYSSLDRALESPHITGIAISGTVGIGLFVRTGQVISLAGSLGATIAYVVGGAMISCVMLCLSEMVAFRHEAGAIFEYPKLFVSHALGFAVGIIYWLSYTTALVTLIVAAGQLLDLPTPGQTAAAMIGIIIVIAIANVLGGVKLYGTLEWIFKWFKVLVIVSLWVVMIYINRNSGIGSRYWDTSYLFPPGFNGVPSNMTGIDANATYADILYGNATFGSKAMEIDGAAGTFLGVITSVNVAIFGFIGVEILIVAAGEAKNARRDLPKATSYTYIITVILYFISTLIVSFNVGYDDPDLTTYGGVSGAYSSKNSPFIIAMNRSTLSKQVATAFKWFFFFSAATTANTNVYVSSRTLFALAANSNVHWARERIGRTSQGKTPLWAIGISLLPCLLALTGISYGNAYGNPTTVVNVFSEISTVSFLCVYVAECWTFIQFMKGLGEKRDQQSYTQFYKRIPRQPLFAWCGLIMCSFFILLNGWHFIFAATSVAGVGRAAAKDVAVGLVAAYFGPILFIGLFVSYKLINRMPQKREKNFWALRSKLLVSATSTPPIQGAIKAPTPPVVPESRLRRIWRYT